MDAILPLFRYDPGTHLPEYIHPLAFFNYNRDDLAHHMSVDFPSPHFPHTTGAMKRSSSSRYTGRSLMAGPIPRNIYLSTLWYKGSWHEEDTGSDEETLTILLMDWFTNKTSAGGQTSKRVILWPFLYTLQEGEHSEWHLPFLLPLFFDDGFSRVWGPRFSVLPKAPWMGHGL